MRIGQGSLDHAQLLGLTANNHHNQAHGVGDHTDRTHIFFLDAEGSEGGGTVQATGTFPARRTVRRLAEGSDQFANWKFTLPEGMVATTVTAVLFWRSAAADAGNYAMRLNALALGTGGDLDAAGATTSFTITADGTTNIGNRTITFPISPSSLQTLAVSVGRASSTDAATDTATGDLDIIGLRLAITIDH